MKIICFASFFDVFLTFSYEFHIFSWKLYFFVFLKKSLILETKKSSTTFLGLHFSLQSPRPKAQGPRDGSPLLSSRPKATSLGP